MAEATFTLPLLRLGPTHLQDGRSAVGEVDECHGARPMAARMGVPGRGGGVRDEGGGGGGDHCHPRQEDKLHALL